MNIGSNFSAKGLGWEAIGHSITCYEKTRNGDQFIIKELKDERILIALVADGISKRPCDWLASEIICHRFWNFFKRTSSLPIKKRIRESIINANNSLRLIEGNCQGLASVLALVVWNYESENIYFVNIGDTRIYRIFNGSIIQISQDEKVYAKRNVQTSIGLRDLPVLTNYLGKESPGINIQELTFLKGDSLLLASDGFYNSRKSSFERDMIALCQSENLQAEFDRIVGKYEVLADDDLTAIIIRNRLVS